MTKKKRAVVVCPGRGSYGREELGYLREPRPSVATMLSELDAWRQEIGAITVSELDGASKYSPALHTPGENASILIYACAMADFAAIDREQYEIVAVTGNSMGWYLALAAAGALDRRAAFSVVNTMGSMMQGGVLGGQIIYPLVDEHWRFLPERQKHIDEVKAQIVTSGKGQVFDSIYLGGYAVVAGDEPGVKALLAGLSPVEERYPFRLINHAAFHTPLMTDVASRGREQLPASLFAEPKLPLIDGRGAIWQEHTSDILSLYDYTLRHQVVCPYDYTTAVKVALREFAPDKLILLGPGSALGGATAQICIKENWHGLSDKEDFLARQEKDPFILAMGRPEQRGLVVA